MISLDGHDSAHHNLTGLGYEYFTERSDNKHLMSRNSDVPNAPAQFYCIWTRERAL